MTPRKVSIIIPARNEQFLVPTVRDVLAKATGDIEVIPVIDGEFNTTRGQIPDDPRVKTLIHTTPQGMRPAINHAARLATGAYLMKLDGHCLVAEGFDEVLASACEGNWVVVPRRYSLDAEAWAIKDTGKSPVDAHYLSYPFEKNKPGAGLHGTVWNERARARKHVLVDDEMSSQGSCWFMSRGHWDRVGELDRDRYGSFIQEGQEIGLKTWLGGGAMKVNKQTFYAHLHKGKQYGRGYFISKKEVDEGATFATRYWMNNLWTDRKHDLRWFVDLFDAQGLPVPSWPRSRQGSIDWDTVERETCSSS